MSWMQLFIAGGLVFEVGQIVACERYVRSGVGVRGVGPREAVAFVWSGALGFYYLWMVFMLFRVETRWQFGALVAVSILGFVARRFCSAGRVFDVLLLEGAVRMGVLLMLFAGAAM